MISVSNINREELAESLGRLPDATNAADLQMLADAMRALTPAQQPFFAYELVHNDLFMMEDPLLRALIEKAKEQGVLAEAMGNMYRVFPELATEMIEQAAQHCLTGMDETSEESLGGWNQQEVAAAYASLYVARDGLTVPFGANVQ